MAIEIEHRFLLAAMPDLGEIKPVSIVQGYLCAEANKVVRIRRIGPDAWITIKGPKVDGAGNEFEYEIPAKDATQMLEMCGAENTLSKNRYTVPVAGGLVWEIDQFTGRHEGLIIAELELPSRNTPFATPHWMNKVVDITDDFRFANAVLIKTPPAEMISNIKSVLEPAGFTASLT